jgi:hypothetical protein
LDQGGNYNDAYHGAARDERIERFDGWFRARLMPAYLFTARVDKDTVSFLKTGT